MIKEETSTPATASTPVSTPSPESTPVAASSAVPKKDMSAMYLPIAIVVAGALVGGGLFFGLSGRSGGSPSTEGQPGQKLNTTKKDIQAAIGTEKVNAFTDIANIKPGDSRFIGKANAPLTMYYWFDYQCPFCKAVEVGGVAGINVAPSMPTLIEKYVNTGKLKIVFKDFAFLGQDSMVAAEYSRAIWDLYPDKFFEWQTDMFHAQDAEGDQGFGDAATIDILTGLIQGIDVNKVKARVASQKAAYDKLIASDQADGAKAGVRGTPGFVIGKKSIDGAQSLDVFVAAIDSQLK